MKSAEIGRPWVRFLELAAALGLLAWRVAIYPWTLWGDFIVILALLWIALVIFSRPQAHQIAVLLAAAWILTVYCLHHLPSLVDLLRWAI